jgi:tRNA (Thr-GGU) A37 N-methylase
MKQEVQAVGFVEAIRPHAEDDFWGGEEATIALTEEFNADALQGLADFSHVEVLFVFHEVEAIEDRGRCSSPEEQPSLASRWYLRAAWQEPSEPHWQHHLPCRSD